MQFEIDKKRVGYCRNAARKLLKENYATLKRDDLPIDISIMAKNMEYEVILLDEMTKNHSALVIRQNKLIGLNKKHHIHRRRFSLAHELGHISLHHPPEENCEDEEIKIFNQEADEFASELLVPLSIFKTLIIELDSNELSKKFLVSREVIFIKAQKNRLFSLLH
jgi:Zn-dependent peptidase ImmA (M78 family)